MEFENLGFIVDVSLTYDFEASLHHSIDLGMLPFLKRVALDELSEEQIADASHLRRNVNTECARLISTHENHRRVEFLPQILYMVVHGSVKIEAIHSITQYKTARLFADYLQMLQKARGTACCDLFSKTVKNMSNCIPG